MNLRDFKKDVDYFVGEFVDDCTLFMSVNPHKDTEKIAAVIDEAVDLYNDMKDRANSKVEKNARKAWFAGLRKEMFERVDALYEKLSNIVAGKDEE
ncbi:MAG: hypothetical protein ACI3ZC_02695 [Candidatus Cryptobacteroides sp.]